MKINDFLTSVEKGQHNACKECPWNPMHSKGIAFGVSCERHGVKWSANEPTKMVSMLIAQDPAGTTPGKTGILCAVCNSQFATDHTAQHSNTLWKAAVSLGETGASATRYLNNHYWANAIMHGFKAGKNASEKEKWLEKQIGPARGCCTTILQGQIDLLSPQIIIATGKVASDSLYDIKLISKSWDGFKGDLSRQVYKERITLPTGKEAIVFCTLHSSTNGVFQAEKYYSNDSKQLLSRRIEQLPDKSSALNFMRRYQDVQKEDRGMRVLFLHWLQIGEEIRRANAEIDFSG